MARDTSQQGLISQTAVLNRLVQLGFEVLLPWADHLGYDLMPSRKLCKGGEGKEPLQNR